MAPRKNQLPVAHFSGFGSQGLRFLRALERNNDRGWFTPRKETYERELHAPMCALVDELTEHFAKAKIPLGGTARRSIFRVYRDVRFRLDKRPYRTNVAAYLSPDGERDTPGGLYIHVQPGRCLFSVCFYRMERPQLDRFRAGMLANPRAFRAMTRALARKNLSLTPPEEDDDSLQRLPRGISADAAGDLAGVFRLRSFNVHRYVPDAYVSDRRFLRAAVTFVRDGLPFLRYGWKSVTPSEGAN